jgi:hypothetical protein
MYYMSFQKNIERKTIKKEIMIKNLISRITMVKTTKPPFYDWIDGKMIYYWQDYYFEQYLAASRWGYRVKLN